jgi:sugar phosphate isomerase/epimerase
MVRKEKKMRLGGFFTETFHSPEEWVAILHAKGYRAAYAPFRPAPGGIFPSADEVTAYHQAAEENDIIIAEVGAWGRNYLSEDDREREKAIEESIRLLQLAEALGARCLVNGAGWCRNPAENYSDETFRRIVENTQTILDAVGPIKTTFTLELLASIYPDTCDSYLELMRAVDRPGFAVHLDLANITTTPRLLYRSTELVLECVRKLGPSVRSLHAKDVVCNKGMVVHMDEIRPGLGSLDYRTLIREMHRLDPDMPLMMEHLPNNEEYRLAADYLRACASAEGVEL